MEASTMDTTRKNMVCAPLTSRAFDALRKRADRMDLPYSAPMRWLVSDLIDGWVPKTPPARAPVQAERAYCRVRLEELGQLERIARAHSTNIGGILRAAVQDFIDGYQPRALKAEAGQ